MLTPDLLAACMTMIEAKFDLKGRQMTQAMREFFCDELVQMDPRVAVEAVRTVVRETPFLPDWADIRRVHAELLGVCPGETIQETLDRHQRERDATRAIQQELEESRKRQAAEMRERHPGIDTPEACRQFIQRRLSGVGGSRSLPPATPPSGATGHITVETPRQPLSREEQIAWAEEQIKKGAA